MIKTPVLKIDEAMAEEAVKLGRKIAVVATVASTVGPSSRLVKSKAKEAGLKQMMILQTKKSLLCEAVMLKNTLIVNMFRRI